jgi:hypothetical protein
VCYNVTTSTTFGLKLNNSDALLYLDALVKQPPLDKYDVSDGESDDSAMSTLCYESTLVEDILNTGYWYELCNEMQGALEKSHSHGGSASIEEGLVYFTQLY